MPEFESYEAKRRRRRKRTVVVVAPLVCILAVAAIGFWATRHTARPVAPAGLAGQIVQARDTAQYSRALQLVRDGLKDADPPAIRTLSEDFQRDLKPDLRLHFLSHGAMPPKEPIGSRLLLTPDDEFYFKLNLVNLPRPCYAYMFLVDSAGNWTVLLPNRVYAPNGNPLSPALYQVPDNIARKLRPPDTPGAEKLFAVEAYWRIGALEDLAAQLAAETNPERARALGQQVLARLKLEDAAADEIPGLAYATLEFHNSGRPSAQEAERQ
jgi:hypothetical protein